MWFFTSFDFLRLKTFQEGRTDGVKSTFLTVANMAKRQASPSVLGPDHGAQEKEMTKKPSELVDAEKPLSDRSLM